MSPRAERLARPEEVVEIIEMKTFQVLGQKTTALKIGITNTIPDGYTLFGRACPDVNCMMAFHEDGPGNTERAIAEHKRYLPEQKLRTGSNTKWSQPIIVIKGRPRFTHAEYNSALAESIEAKKRKRAKARK